MSFDPRRLGNVLWQQLEGRVNRSYCLKKTTNGQKVISNVLLQQTGPFRYCCKKKMNAPWSTIHNLGVGGRAKFSTDYHNHTPTFQPRVYRDRQTNACIWRSNDRRENIERLEQTAQQEQKITKRGPRPIYWLLAIFRHYSKGTQVALHDCYVGC